MNTYLKETMQIVENLRANLIILGQRLKKIKEENLTEGVYERFEDFLEEIDVKPAAASKAVKIYTHWCEERGFDVNDLKEVGDSKLYAAIKPFKELPAPEALEQAKVLRKQDIEKWGKDECDEHEPITVCGKCRVRIY